MKILFIIALLSFAALAWAVLAITRHIRKGASSKKSMDTDADLSLELEARLIGITKPATVRPAEPAPLANQNFSYFNKEASDEVYPTTRQIQVDPQIPASDRT